MKLVSKADLEWYASFGLGWDIRSMAQELLLMRKFVEPARILKDSTDPFSSESTPEGRAGFWKGCAGVLEAFAAYHEATKDNLPAISTSPQS